MVSQQVIKVILEAENRINSELQRLVAMIERIRAQSSAAMNSAKNAQLNFNKSVVRSNTTLGKLQSTLKTVGVSGQSSFNQLSAAQRKTLLEFSSLDSKSRNVAQKINEIGLTGQSSFNQLTASEQRVIAEMSNLTQSTNSVMNNFSRFNMTAQAAQTALQQLDLDPSLNTSLQSAKVHVSSLGVDINSTRGKLQTIGTAAKTSLTGGFNQAVTSAKNSLNNLKTSISSAKTQLSNLNQNSRTAGGSLGFLRNAASMTVGMIGYDLVNSMAQSARESINAAGNFQAFGKRMNMSQSEIDSFSQHCDKLQQSFKKVDMKAVGASALEMGVKLKLPKESMEELTKTTAVMSSAFVKEGRTQEDAILAVSDAMDGQFRRLQELGISQDQLKNNGWDGDINNKTSLLQAMNKTLDEMGFTDTAMQVNTLDEAYQMLSVSGGQLLGSILIPLTPTLIGIATAVVGVIDGIKNFMGQLQAAWSGLPDWVQDAAGIMVMAGAVLLLMGYISSLGGAVGLLKTALAPIIGIIGGITAPMIAVVAVIGAVIFAVYELGKAFGWWNDVGSMIDAIKNNIGRLWNAFINHPDVQGLIKGIQSAWQGLNDFLKPVIDWLGGIWDQMFPESAKGKVDGTRIIIDAIGAAFAMLKPIISPIPAIIGGVISILSALWSVAQPIGQGIYNALKPIVCILLGCSPGIVPALRTVQEVFTSVWNAIVGFISGVISSVVSAIQPIIDILTQITEFYLSAFIFAWQTIVIVFNIVIAAVNQIIGIFLAFLSGQINLSTMLSMLWSTISGMFNSVLSSIISRVTTFASNIITKALSAARGFVNAIINNIRSLPGRVYSLLIAIVSRIASAGARWISAAKSKATALVSGVISNVSQLPGKVYTELMNIGPRILSAGADLVAKAMDIGKNIVNGILNAMGIHSPGIIQNKVVTEFENMLTRVEGKGDDAYNNGAIVGKRLVDGFNSQNIEGNLSNINLPADIPENTMQPIHQTTEVSAEITPNSELPEQYSKINEEVKPNLDQLVLMNKNSFGQIGLNEQSTLNRMTNHVHTSMINILNSTKNGLMQTTALTTTNLNKMRNSTSKVTKEMVKAWNSMKNSIVSAAKKIKTDSNAHFTQLSSTIGTFYRKLQNPSSWGAGGGSGSPSTTRNIGRPSGGSNKIRNILNPTIPQTISINTIRRNPCFNECVEYIAPKGPDVNTLDLMKTGCVDCVLGITDNGKSAGWMDSVPNNVSYIKQKTRDWTMKGPVIAGKYETGLSFKVSDFENGTPNIGFSSFKNIAESLFSQIDYDFYFDSDKYGSWQNALMNGKTNCSDGSDALIALAHTCGLSAYKQHGSWNGIGHFWAVVEGHKMDTTGFQHGYGWTPSQSAGTGGRADVLTTTLGKISTTLSELSSPETKNIEKEDTTVVDDVVLSGDVNININHNLENIPDGIDEQTLMKLIRETTNDENWIKSLTNNIKFQLADLKAKTRLERKQKRSKGVLS